MQEEGRRRSCSRERERERMADVGNSARCNETCGCPSPCPGGEGCRFEQHNTRCISGSGDPNVQHAYCKCGEHCGCNPCGCDKKESSGVGRTFCTCGTGCNCEKCAAA